MQRHPIRFMPRLTRLVRFALLPLSLVAALASAQNISDVPVAVRNTVAPNFMFVIDNSASMRNIVPGAPYSPTKTYLSSCPASLAIAAGNWVDLYMSGGVPYINTNGTLYRHTTAVSSGSRACFDNAATYYGRISVDALGTGGPGLYTGHFLNWYFGAYDGPASGWSDRKLLTSAGAVSSRMELARAAAGAVVNALPVPATSSAAVSVRTGLSTYRLDWTQSGGQLRVPIGDLTTGTRSTLVSAIQGITPDTNTPLASTLADVGRYFATGYNGNITAGSVSTSIDAFLRQSGANVPTARDSCPLGAPSCTSASSPQPIQQWCQRSYAFVMTDGLPSVDAVFDNNPFMRNYLNGPEYLDDVAKALYDVDLRPDLVAPSGRPKRNNLVTYTIGFADLQARNSPLLKSTADQGGGLYLGAEDGPALVNAFQTVVSDALAKAAAAAAVGVVNPQLSVNDTGYVSSYNSSTWDGDIKAFRLDAATALPTGAELWSASTLLDARAGSDRLIASFDGSIGRPFTSGNFAGTPSTLTAGVIGYVRGDRTGEGSTYRARRHVLGDIVNAEAAVVNYAGVPVLFQGANDGMLHVFDGRTDAGVTTRGRELWAYVPRLVHPNLALLSQAGYSHKFFVDATPAVAAVTGTGSMTRILVGGLGKGGVGYYALDISDYAAADESSVAAKAKWEFKPANMGYSFGTPLVVRTAAGWRVIVTSGYDNGTNQSGDGGGHVWVLDPSNGNVIQRIDTGAGSATNPSGLAQLAKQDGIAPDAQVRYVWGGDMLGNVWRFDLESFTATKIAVLKDGIGNAQPIYAAPTVGTVTGSSSRYFVYVGTGRNLSSDDVPGTATANVWATQQQSMYGLIDDPSTVAVLPNIRGSNGTGCPSGGGNGDFVCQSLTSLGGTPVSYRATTNGLNLAARRGWYVDLPMANGRIDTNSALVLGTLVFTANVPTNAPCDPGGSSYFFAIDAGTGGAVAKVLGGNEYYDTAGFFIGYALASRPVPLQVTNGIRALIRLSDQTYADPLIPVGVATTTPWRRVYWRALK